MVLKSEITSISFITLINTQSLSALTKMKKEKNVSLDTGLVSRALEILMRKRAFFIMTMSYFVS
jgi:hypothetical protein